MPWSRMKRAGVHRIAMGTTQSVSSEPPQHIAGRLQADMSVGIDEVALEQLGNFFGKLDERVAAISLNDMHTLPSRFEDARDFREHCILPVTRGMPDDMRRHDAIEGAVSKRDWMQR